MTLEQRLWDALNAMQLLSNGATAKLDGDRVHGSRADHLFPVGESKCEFLIYQRRFARAYGHTARLEIVQEAEAELATWKRATPPKDPEWGSYWWKVMIANLEGPDKPIVNKYTISRQTLWNYRRKYRTKAA